MTMEITQVEIREFEYRLEDVGSENGHQVYQPGSVQEPPGFILTIKTDTGLEGHYRGYSFVPPMVAQIKMAAPEFLIGANPLNREKIWYDIWRAFRHTDHLGLGPIDIALWDLAGKCHETSVSSMLGRYRERIPAYASTYFVDESSDGLNGPDAFVSFAEECLAAGYDGFKIHGHPTGNPDRDIEICKSVNEAVGQNMDLMLDVASEYDSYADTLRVGRTMDDLGFFWYEDPCAETGQSIQMNRELARQLDTPIIGMEHVRTGPFGAVDHLAENATDFIRANAHLDGGITSAMKIAHIAEGFGKDVEFHVGGPSHLHCSSAVRNTNYFEHALLHPAGIDWMSSQGFTEKIEQINQDGTVSIPDGDGLGVEIDWTFVENRQTNETIISEPGASGTS
jgi:L-alanine-DL-glutamate epimerase-like enolase superfamily enzyme